MYIFTSVTSNYIPKARVLAESVKRFHPEAHFTLVLSDARPVWLGTDTEPFDSVLQIEELGITDFRRWVFKHSVVEVCTAVKGFAFQEIFRRHSADKVIYLDPDIVVFGSLDPLVHELDRASVLLTPHQTEPETTIEAIIDNEVCSLKHGVFNLGFLAVRNSCEGRRFIDWWASRLEHFCFDDIPGGLFTDQRWIDLAPCFFDDLRILRDPIYNVCTWNLTHRKVGGSMDGGLLVNGQPLCFYHFSGFDSGAQEQMVNKYSGEGPVLYEMREWYIEACRTAGQDQYGKSPCVYGFFDNGEPITAAHRYLYRTRPDLSEIFEDPYTTEGALNSYLHWFKQNVQSNLSPTCSTVSTDKLLAQLLVAQNELNKIKNSITWKLSRSIAKIVDPVLRLFN